LGLQIGTQFCPGNDETATRQRVGRPQIIAGGQSWVFLWTEKGVNRWFFDIYIQGSKNNF
jgi:hypothetical protein